MEHIEAYGFGHIYNHLAVRICLRSQRRCCVYQTPPRLRRHPVFLTTIFGSNRPVDETSWRAAMLTVVNGARWTSIDDACGAGSDRPRRCAGRR